MLDLMMFDQFHEIVESEWHHELSGVEVFREHCILLRSRTETCVVCVLNSIRVFLAQLQNILQISGAIVDLIDVQGSSVMVCLEDGWDFTTQVKLIENNSWMEILK